MNKQQLTIKTDFSELEEKIQSHMRPVQEAWKPCQHPEHEPPMMLYVPHGQEYVHVCPGCLRSCVVRSNDVTMLTITGRTVKDHDPFYHSLPLDPEKQARMDSWRSAFAQMGSSDTVNKV